MHEMNCGQYTEGSTLSAGEGGGQAGRAGPWLCLLLQCHLQCDQRPYDAVVAGRGLKPHLVLRARQARAQSLSQPEQPGCAHGNDVRRPSQLSLK
jgi:hypothetical protein